jgi:hypothetical protein
MLGRSPTTGANGSRRRRSSEPPSSSGLGHRPFRAGLGFESCRGHGDDDGWQTVNAALGGNLRLSAFSSSSTVPTRTGGLGSGPPRRAMMFASARLDSLPWNDFYRELGVAERWRLQALRRTREFVHRHRIREAGRGGRAG